MVMVQEWNFTWPLLSPGAISMYLRGENYKEKFVKTFIKHWLKHINGKRIKK